MNNDKINQNLNQNLIIAIDGTSCSGKGAIASALSAYFNFAHVDTGLFFRKYAYLMHTGQIAIEDEVTTLKMANISNSLECLRGAEISSIASIIAANSAVRKILLKLQKSHITKLTDKKIGAIVEGRDIATTVCPNAICKIFIDAKLEIRAQRRFEQNLKLGLMDDYEKIYNNLKERDLRDSQRSCSPLHFNKDYLLLDTSNYTLDESVKAAVKLVKSSLELAGFL